MSKTNSCIDCNNPCDKRCKRCQACSNKINSKLKVRRPNFCKSCNKELAKRKYKLCHSCNMKKRWSNKTYRENTKASIKASFVARWSNPEIQKKIIKILTTFNGTSKLEKKVGAVALQYGFQSSVAIDKYLVDLIDEKRKIIIEVNGDYWHCNPNTWNKNDIHPFKKITASAIWDHDLKRKNYLESLGYVVYVLWEADIIKGKSSFLEKFFKNLK